MWAKVGGQVQGKSQGTTAGAACWCSSPLLQELLHFCISGQLQGIVWDKGWVAGSLDSQPWGTPGVWRHGIEERVQKAVTEAGAQVPTLRGSQLRCCFPSPELEKAHNAKYPRSYALQIDT